MSREERTDKRQRNFRYFDYSLLVIVLFMVCFGLVILYSSATVSPRLIPAL